ncbi:MAG: zf-HC2 domain-containing protein [Planctomycetes bacterium]|nr:zf-HC2 domain-containing protein [Planctomycetota bacterium]
MASIDHASHIDEQLSAYLDDELSPEERLQVESHLKQCADCRAEFKRLQRTAELTSESLRAVRCISPEDKAAYIHGRMNASERSEVEEHLARCRNCSAEIEELREWVEEKVGPGEISRPAPRHKKPGGPARFISIFFPLAAAAAIVIGLASSVLNISRGPAITALNVRNAVTRSPNEPAEVDVGFGSEGALHTNDEIQLILDAGTSKHAVVLWMDSRGRVAALKAGPFSDPRYHKPLAGREDAAQAASTIVLPSATERWRIGSAVGTDAIFVIFTKEPLADAVINKLKQALSSVGPPPELADGSILWLDHNGRWTRRAPEQLRRLLAALTKALAGHGAACRGVVFAHE